MSREDGTQALSYLGITASQAKVYLALLRLRTDSRASTIAKFADIPRQDVYRVLDELQHLGIAQQTLVRPTSFRAAPPKEAVGILMRRKRGEFFKMEREANKFVQKATQIFGETPTPLGRDQFFLIADREALTCKAMQTIENTQATVKDIIPLSEFVPWLTVLSKSINEALSRGVKIRWITEKPTNITSLPKSVQTCVEHPNFTLRFISSLPKAKLAIFDNKEVILGIFTDGGFARSPALWSNNSSLVTLAESYFEACWKSGLDQSLIESRL